MSEAANDILIVAATWSITGIVVYGVAVILYKRLMGD